MKPQVDEILNFIKVEGQEPIEDLKLFSAMVEIVDSFFKNRNINLSITGFMSDIKLVITKKPNGFNIGVVNTNIHSEDTDYGTVTIPLTSPSDIIILTLFSIRTEEAIFDDNIVAITVNLPYTGLSSASVKEALSNNIINMYELLTGINHFSEIISNPELVKQKAAENGLEGIPEEILKYLCFRELFTEATFSEQGTILLNLVAEKTLTPELQSLLDEFMNDIHKPFVEKYNTYDVRAHMGEYTDIIKDHLVDLEFVKKWMSDEKNNEFVAACMDRGLDMLAETHTATTTVQ